MKEIIGLTVIIISTSIAIGFLIAKWWIERKGKNKRKLIYNYEIDNDIDYALDIGVYHFDLEPEQVN